MFKDVVTKVLVFFTMMFNVIDIFVTIKIIKFGKMDENNPFMKFFLDMDGEMPFIFAKTFLICAGCYFLYKYREKLMAQIGAYLCFCFYWALICQFYFFVFVK